MELPKEKQTIWTSPAITNLTIRFVSVFPGSLITFLYLRYCGVNGHAVRVENCTEDNGNRALNTAARHRRCCQR